MRIIRDLLAPFAAVLLLCPSHAAAQSIMGTIPVGADPKAIAIDPIANHVYVANNGSNTVTAVDGATWAATSIAVGAGPQYLAVNPESDRVYVSNVSGSNVSVIDGNSASVVATLDSGGSGTSTINPVTQRAYIARFGTADEVNVVDTGSDSYVFTMGIGSYQPMSLAVNTVTNTLYVATFATGDITAVPLVPEVDEPADAHIQVGQHAIAVAVNPVTNKIYAVTDNAFSPIGIIDGATNTNTAPTPAAGHAQNGHAIAVNTVTNKIYAAFDNEVVVIDGATNALSYIPSSAPVAIGIDAITNKIYVPNSDGTMTIIDGDTMAATTMAIPAGAVGVAVNPVTDTIYVLGSAISVIAGSETDTIHSTPITTSIAPLPGNSSGASATFTINASTSFSPAAPALRNVYYQVDSRVNSWTAASGGGPYTAKVAGLTPGTHTIYAFATDSQLAPSNNTGAQDIPFVGSIASYTFQVSIPNAFDFNADGKPDILWSDTTNGNTFVWYMNGITFVSDAFVAGVDPSWQVQGIADFNGDGQKDLVWRNTSNGNTYVWYMNGTSFVSDAPLFSLPPEWAIQGVADFNADGHPDFLMRNTTTGVAFAWYFDNATAMGNDFLFQIDPAWKVEQVGDMNADGQPDLLFRNTSSGLAFAWYTQYGGGTLSLAGSSAPIFTIDPAWEVTQLTDWNGDGSPDLLFRNASSGVVFVWYMNGTTLASSDYVTQIDPSWEIVPRR